MTDIDLSVNLAGIHMRNPVMLASGTCGYGPEYAELLDLNQLGAIAVFILPALETSHALAWVALHAQDFAPDQVLVINLSGRGDKDILTVAELDGITL